MGCWAVHSFGNDDAADWLCELEEQDGWGLVAGTLAELAGAEGYIDAPYATRALAAIETVAAALGNPTKETLAASRLATWLATVSERPSQELISSCMHSIDLVLGQQSELAELWQETDDYGLWQEDVALLRSRLGV